MLLVSKNSELMEKINYRVNVAKLKNIRPYKLSKDARDEHFLLDTKLHYL